MSISSKLFLCKFFGKLHPNDFKSDRVLEAFYISYERQKEQDNKGNIEPIELFQFFTEYLIRNKSISELSKEEEVKKIHDKIVSDILNPADDVADDDPRINRIKQSTSRPSASQSIESRPIYKLNKLQAMGVICEAIKMSFIILDNIPHTDLGEDDTEFRNNSTVMITDEIIADGGKIPTAKKDVSFERKCQIIDIWHSCETNCNKFLELDSRATVLKRSFVVDAGNLTIDSQSTMTYILEKPLSIEDRLVAEQLTTKYSGKICNGSARLVKSNALSESMRLAKNNQQNLLIVSEHQFNTGANSDQGFESRITPLYLSSSYSLSLNTASYAYPLEPNFVIYSPSVLVFKDHTKPNYPMLGPTAGCKLSVMASAAKYKPSVNIPIDKYSVDPKLYLVGTKYSDADAEVLRRQIECIFTAALFFGFTTIVLDDRGPTDSHSPIHHTAKILAEGILKYKKYFNEILVAVNEDAIYDIYKIYLTGL